MWKRAEGSREVVINSLEDLRGSGDTMRVRNWGGFSHSECSWVCWCHEITELTHLAFTQTWNHAVRWFPGRRERKLYNTAYMPYGTPSWTPLLAVHSRLRSTREEMYVLCRWRQRKEAQVSYMPRNLLRKTFLVQQVCTGTAVNENRVAVVSPRRQEITYAPSWTAETCFGFYSWRDSENRIY